MEESVVSGGSKKRKQNETKISKQKTKKSKELQIKGTATDILHSLLDSFGFSSLNVIPTKVFEFILIYSGNQSNWHCIVS